MSQQSQQSRSTEALAAAAAALATAERAARNITRPRGQQTQPHRDPVSLPDLITALLFVHDISGRMGKTVDHYAQAVRWPLAGYNGLFGEHEDYPGSVIDATSRAERELTTLAGKLQLPAVGFSTDAIASLDIALADWRNTMRRNGASA